MRSRTSLRYRRPIGDFHTIQLRIERSNPAAGEQGAGFFSGLRAPASGFGFAGSPVERIFVEVLYAVFIDEKIGLAIAGDSNDVLIVVLDPAPNFLSIDKFHNNGDPGFREAVNIFGLTKSRLGRGLPSVSAAGVFIGSCAVP